MEPSNILNIKSLSVDWCDKDVVLLHACFQILTDCVEKENLLEAHANWDTDESLKPVKEEMEFLYHWWKERQEIENGADVLRQYETDNEMLIRLIKVRQFLWT